MKTEASARPVSLSEDNGGSGTDPNPRYGEKRDYRRITITVPQTAYESLIQESARRKIAGEHNQLLSALLREAITDYLKKLQARTSG